MPGFNAKQLQYNARNANSVAMYIGDIAVAFAQTVNHSFGYTTTGIYGVGSAKPQEIQQLRVGPTITLNEFALTQAGEALITGGASLAALLSNNSFDIAVIDGLAQEVLFSYIGCVSSSFDENIPANQPVSDALTFLAMDVLDQDGNSLLNIPGAFQLPSTTAVAGNGLGLNIAASASL
jgi:hypothetical protein